MVSVFTSLSFLIFFIWVFSLFSWWIWLKRCQFCLSFNEPDPGFIDPFNCLFSLYVIYCSNLISLLTLDFVCCCSSSSFRCRGRVFIWDFSILFRKACIPMNFPLRTAFALSHRFCVVCSFSFVSRYFFYLLLHLIVNTFIIIIF